jgi:hypothetical protein
MKKDPIIDRNDSGKVNVSQDIITWAMISDDRITIDLNDVKFIGEYTTDDGPFVDDWFLSFVYSDGTWDNISVYADNIESVKDYLSKKFSLDTSYYLANSTKWDSQILYPKAFLGHKLFEMISPKGYKEPETLIDHIKLSLGLGKYGKAWYFDLTPEVKAALQNACA